jgi:hypothetical protein
VIGGVTVDTSDRGSIKRILISSKPTIPMDPNRNILMVKIVVKFKMKPFHILERRDNLQIPRFRRPGCQTKEPLPVAGIDPEDKNLS